MTRTNELLPCPFCGGEASVIDHHNDDGSMSVGCADDTCLGFSGLGWLYKTEAEAIAAWNTRADYHGYEKAAIEAWKSIKTWNTRAEHGTLTAEQVCEAIMSADRWEKPMGNTGLTNTHLIIRDDGWQAIADELNAELGDGTCEPKWTLQGKTQTQEFWRCECGNCGECFGIETRESFPFKMTVGKVDVPRFLTVGKVDVPRFCPNCGKRVSA